MALILRAHNGETYPVCPRQDRFTYKEIHALVGGAELVELLLSDGNNRTNAMKLGNTGDWMITPHLIQGLELLPNPVALKILGEYYDITSTTGKEPMLLGDALIVSEKEVNCVL